MDMIERVARAIAHSDGARITGPSRHRATDEFGWDPSHDYMRKYIDKHWKEHEHAARAAIEAMREPPSELYEALYEAMFIEKYDGTQAPMIGAGVDAFIDAALKDPAP